MMSGNTLSDRVFGVPHGLLVIYDFFAKKMFTSVPAFLSILLLSIGIDWIATYFWPNPEYLPVFYLVILGDMVSGISRDLRRGEGFDMEKLLMVPKALLGYSLLIYAMWQLSHILFDITGVHILTNGSMVGFVIIIIAHLGSFIKNMVLLGLFKRGPAKWIYNYINASKNMKDDALWDQYAKKKGLDNSETGV